MALRCAPLATPCAGMGRRGRGARGARNRGSPHSPLAWRLQHAWSMNTLLGANLALSLCLFGALTTGCAATQLHPGADSVIVSHTPAPAGCKFAGTLVGEQGGSLTG